MAVGSLNTALPFVRGTICKTSQSTRLVEPRTVASSAPGTEKPNWKLPSGRLVAEPLVIFTVVRLVIMLKGGLKSYTSGLVVLRIFMV